MAGIQERLIRARNSSHLECDEFDGDINVIAAAGMSGEPAGAVFSRIRQEFDEAHASVKRAAPELYALDPETQEGRRARVNLRFAATLRLRNLQQAKAEMLGIAFKLAQRHGFDDMGGAELQEVAWQALSIWLDPTCSACGGLGSIGGYGVQKQRCSKCKGTKVRRGYAGNNDGQRTLINRICDAMNEAMGRFHQATDRKMG